MRISIEPAPHYAHQRRREAVNRQTNAAAIMRRGRKHAEELPAAPHGLKLARQHRVPEGIDLAGFIDWISHVRDVSNAPS
jgi:hypothetical protein